MKYFFVTILTIAFSLPAAAENFIPASSVLLYNDRAQITRTTVITMEPGENKLVFRDLPPYLDDESLRTSLDSTKLHIASVNSYLVPLAGFNDPGVRNLAEKIKQAEKDKQQTELEIARLYKKTVYINSLAEMTVKAISGNIFYSDSTDVEGWRSSVTSVLNDSIETESKINQLKLDLEDLEQTLSRLNKKLDQLHSLLNKTERVTEIKVLNTETTPVPGNLEITYLIRNAGWTPLYNIAVGANNQVAVTYLAEIFQETGENWNKVKLTLSTAVPDMIQYRPGISPLNLYGIAAGKPDENIVAFQKNAEADNIKPESTTGKTSSFLIQAQGTYSYSSGKKKHSLEIGRFSDKSGIFLKTVPKLSKRIYEISELPNRLNIPLLPGRANIFKNGGYIGRISIPYISPGSKFNLPSGLHQNLLARFSSYRDRESSGILGNKATVTRTETVILENSDKTSQVVVVENNVPVSDTDSVSIEIVSDASTPGYREKSPASGILQWEVTVPPGGEKKIELKYKVTVPENAADGI